jgi:hypothetical protein
MAWLANINNSSARFYIPVSPVELPWRMDLLLMSCTSIARKPKLSYHLLLLTLDYSDLLYSEIAGQFT